MFHCCSSSSYYNKRTGCIKGWRKFMDWNIGWVFWIGCSYFLTIVNCYFVLVKKAKYNYIIGVSGIAFFFSCLAWRITNVFAMDWRWRSWNANPRSSKSSSSIYHQIFNSCRHNNTVNNNWFTSHKIVLIQTTDSNHYGYAMELLPWKFDWTAKIKYVSKAKWSASILIVWLFIFWKRSVMPWPNRKQT